jgi:hypothetical protein
LADYAAAQPCTIQCPPGSPGCTSPPPRYDPKASVPLTRAAYNTNSPSFWGGRFWAKPLARDNEVYEGVIVRTAWNRQTKSFFANFPRPTNFAKITDGASNTFLIGEKYVRPDLYGGGSWSDDKGWSDGWDLDVMRSTCFQPYQDNDPTGYSFQPQNGPNDIFGNVADVYYFGSAHVFKCCLRGRIRSHAGLRHRRRSPQWARDASRRRSHRRDRDELTMKSRGAAASIVGHLNSAFALPWWITSAGCAR